MLFPGHVHSPCWAQGAHHHWEPCLLLAEANFRFFVSGLKCNLVPTDDITVYYRCPSKGDYLDTIIQIHTDFILATIKAPLKPYPVPPSDKVLIQELTQVSAGSSCARTSGVAASAAP